MSIGRAIDTLFVARVQSLSPTFCPDADSGCSALMQLVLFDHGPRLPIDEVSRPVSSLVGPIPMKTVGSYEAKTHLPRLLSLVQKGATITITKRGKPIAILSPAPGETKPDVPALIAEFRAFNKQRASSRTALTFEEIKEMIDEGRP